MHRKCQCLLVVPVLAAELLIVFSLLTAYLLARMPREPSESPDCFVIDQYLPPGVCLLRAVKIVHILFPVLHLKDKSHRTQCYLGIKCYWLMYAFAVINTAFSFSSGLALCVSPHCNALLHLRHYWHAGKNFSFSTGHK